MHLDAQGWIWTPRGGIWTPGEGGFGRDFQYFGAFGRWGRGVDLDVIFTYFGAFGRPGGGFGCLGVDLDARGVDFN